MWCPRQCSIRLAIHLYIPWEFASKTGFVRRTSLDVERDVECESSRSITLHTLALLLSAMVVPPNSSLVLLTQSAGSSYLRYLASVPRPHGCRAIRWRYLQPMSEQLSGQWNAGIQRYSYLQRATSISSCVLHGHHGPSMPVPVSLLRQDFVLSC
jgi:hypothetical protein